MCLQEKESRLLSDECLTSSLYSLHIQDVQRVPYSYASFDGRNPIHCDRFKQSYQCVSAALRYCLVFQVHALLKSLPKEFPQILWTRSMRIPNFINQRGNLIEKRRRRKKKKEEKKERNVTNPRWRMQNFH